MQHKQKVDDTLNVNTELCILLKISANYLQTKWGIYEL